MPFAFAGALGAPSTPRKRPPAAADRRAVYRGKESKKRTAPDIFGGNIVNAFALGSGQPLSGRIMYTQRVTEIFLCFVDM